MKDLEPNEIFKSELVNNPDVRFAMNDVMENDGSFLGMEEGEKVPLREKLILAFLLAMVLLLGIAHYAYHLDQLPIEKKYLPMFPRLIVGGMLILIVLVVARTVRVFYLNRVKQKAIKHNLNRFFKFSIASVLSLIVISILFVNWYTAALSFGIVSLILGFALQTPILSFIGWLYIVFRRPFKLGDRIKINESVGDVIDIDYLDTTLWEVQGNLSVEQYTGRILRIPNANLLSLVIVNYSWALYPYVYNETKFYIQYGADLKNISQALKVTVDEIIGEEIRHHGVYKELLRKINVNTSQMGEKTEVVFKPMESHVEVVILYPVLPMKSGEMSLLIYSKVFEMLTEKFGEGIFPDN